MYSSTCGGPSPILLILRRGVLSTLTGGTRRRASEHMGEFYGIYMAFFLLTMSCRSGVVARTARGYDTHTDTHRHRHAHTHAHTHTHTHTHTPASYPGAVILTEPTIYDGALSDWYEQVQHRLHSRSTLLIHCERKSPCTPYNMFMCSYVKYAHMLIFKVRSTPLQGDGDSIWAYKHICGIYGGLSLWWMITVETIITMTS